MRQAAKLEIKQGDETMTDKAGQQIFVNPAIVITALCFLVVLGCSQTTAVKSAEFKEDKIPVIYCTDLFHPHDDPDDHFDIASLYAICEIDIKAIILDQGEKQKQKPGLIPVSQLNYITGRNVPWAIGLSEKLKSPGDKGLWQPEQFQDGSELVLETLRTSSVPVTIIAVGSARDIAAAFNRSPDLFKRKVDRLFLFAGEASNKDFTEYNVSVDTNAFINIMNSGLPIYWVPCFDGGLWQNKGKASFWTATHSDLLKYTSKKVMNFFIYALLRKQKNEYIEFLTGEVDAGDKTKVLSGRRNLWCTAIFTYIANRKIILRDNEYLSVPASTEVNSDSAVEIFDFSGVSVFVDNKAVVCYENIDRSNKMRQFRILRKDIYPRAMTSVTAHLLSDLERQP